jgi:putative flippase GtrA
MRRVRVLLAHPLAGSTLRYAIAGAVVGLVYLGGPILLNGVLGLPIEVAIPISYLTAICLHFNLQRHFVFRHVAEFALSRREQAWRYVMIAAVQYPTTAVLTAVLPGLTGWSPQAAYLLIATTMSLTFFIVLRTAIFHPSHDGPSLPVDGEGDACPHPASRDEPDVREQQLLR